MIIEYYTQTSRRDITLLTVDFNLREEGTTLSPQSPARTIHLRDESIASARLREYEALSLLSVD